MFDVVIPVPLHAGKLRERGFNQAFLLVRDWTHMAKRLCIKLPFRCIDRNILQRHNPTIAQTGLGKKERQKNIRGVFNVKNKEKIIQKRILLVDDVYTTGATANECAKTLLAGGAARVDVLTLARTI
jgi:ComF family protein